MKCILLQVGRTADERVASLIDEYLQRLRRLLPLEVETIPELRAARSLPEAQQREQEAELILSRLAPSDHVVLLDEHGREFRSVEFAQFLEARAASGLRRMVFVIGGPYGFGEKVYARAAEKISLSRMTFSHQMVRLFFVEQFYRAQTILRGMPYHHE